MGGKNIKKNMGGKMAGKTQMNNKKSGKGGKEESHGMKNTEIRHLVKEFAFMHKFGCNWKKLFQIIDENHNGVVGHKVAMI